MGMEQPIKFEQLEDNVPSKHLQPLPSMHKTFKMEPDTSTDTTHLTDLVSNPISQHLLSALPDHSENVLMDFDFHNLQNASLISQSDGSDDHKPLDLESGKKRRSKMGQRRRRSPSLSSTKSSRIKKQISPEELNAQRTQANIRERMRTQNLNEAFQNLRQIIPTMPSDKMSKIQTLKLASDYIDFLYNVLKAGEVDESGQINSNGDPSLSLNYAFNMWRMQDVWNSNHRHQSSPEEDLS